MTRWINIIILITIFATSWHQASSIDRPVTSDRLFWLVAIPFTMFALLPIFFGMGYGIFARGRVMNRPSINKLMLTRNSPLQFIWFGGMIFCAAGSGHMARFLRDGISSEGLTIVAGGLGVILGCKLVVRIFPMRFCAAAN